MHNNLEDIPHGSKLSGHKLNFKRKMKTDEFINKYKLIIIVK